MAKFYAQSGTLKMVVHAREADRAALWVVHRALAQVLPIFDDDELSAQEKQAVAMFRGTLVLNDEIRLSEEGFDRNDAIVFRTADLVREWGQLVIALQKIDEFSHQEHSDQDQSPGDATHDVELCLAV